RRRHTRFSRDWSSDVCSSDLGFAVFTVGSFACSLAPNISSMVAFRVVQALGASMMIAMGPAIITRVFPPTERGMALGINSMVVELGRASGRERGESSGVAHAG